MKIEHDRPLIRIMKTTVDAAKPEATRYTVWDDKLKGFGLRVTPGGVKTYVARYRTRGGRAGQLQQVTVGRHGKLTPDQARADADKIIAAATLGEDPADARAKARADITVEQLCEVYFAEGCNTKKASTLYTDRGRVKRHVLPLLGSRRVASVTQAHIEAFMRDVAGGKTAMVVKTKKRGKSVVKGGQGTAARTLGLLGAIFAFAVARHLRTDNPVRGVRRHKDRRMTRFLSHAEMGALGDALNAAAKAKANDSALAIIRLLAVSGCRKSEITNLQWSEVDARLGYLRLHDSKTGQKNVAVGASVVAILGKIARTESPYVFPADGAPDRPFQAVDKTWRVVRAAAGLSDVRLHDLRHSFASTGLSAGHGLQLLGKLLGHNDVTTTSRYAHVADDPMRAAANDIAALIDEAMRKNVSTPTAANDNTAAKQQLAGAPIASAEVP